MTRAEVGPPFVSGIVLAAGRSSRFGDDPPKQLLEVEGRPLVRRAAEAALASKLGEVVVVLGHHADEVGRALEGLDVVRVLNSAFASGLATSVVRGLAALAPRARAAVFLPCDQPWLGPGLIDALCTTYDERDGSIVVPNYRGRRGAPTLFDRALFPELSRLEGDVGGREVIRRHPERVVRIELESELPLLDLDTPGDLARLLEAKAREDKKTSRFDEIT